MKKMFKVPGEKQKPTAKLRVDTCCPVCLWQGDFMETLLVDDSNDACPRCQNTTLVYIIS
jgi:hypothetical protein